MSRKTKILITAGGTGGHVLPGYNLANHLKDLNYEVDLVTDKRGIKYLYNLKNISIFLLPSSPLITKNLLMIFFFIFFHFIFNFEITYIFSF